MRIFFVIDILSGVAVAAERGERSRYRPLNEKSTAVGTSDPVEIVKEIRPRYLYVADLDRIMGKGNNLNLISAISGQVEGLIADVGLRKIDEVSEVANYGKFVPVIGTETFDITQLAENEEKLDRYYLSLDISDEILDASGKFANWTQVVEYVNTLNPEGLIVLTLRNVGTLKPRFDLVGEIITKSSHPVFLGGGIGGVEHLRHLCWNPYDGYLGLVI